MEGKEIIFTTFKEALEGKDVTIVNVTPHSINIQSPTGDVVVVPPSVQIDAFAVEEEVNELFVKTKFLGTKEGEEIINNIHKEFNSSGLKSTLVIVGSIIAAQAYPEEVVAMTPVVGYERVAPSEKRMNCNKFTIFQKSEVNA